MTLTNSYDALIIGGGLAGAGTAFALAKRSLKVLLCETQPHLAAKSSGNAQGLLMPYVTTQASPPERLYAQGFNFTEKLLTETFSERALYTECGALQLPATKRLSRIVTETSECVGDVPILRASAKESSELAGIVVPTQSFYISKAGFCNPVQVTQTLVDSCGPYVTVHCSQEVVDLRWNNASWNVSFRNGDNLTTPIVILCGAYEISKLSVTSWVPLEPIRGQTLQAPLTDASKHLRTVVSYDGYITPAQHGLHFAGAHYRHNDMNEAPHDQDTHEVLSRLYRALPSIKGLSATSSRVCFRTSTHDRMPYIGRLPTQEGTNLFINAGHGSRGLLTAPLGGEIIARTICNEPLAWCHEAVEISSPARLSRRFTTNKFAASSAGE